MSAAEKLFKRAHANRVDWKPGDIETLYIGYGFQKREGASHTIYYHPTFSLQATVPRHSVVKKCYVDIARKNISKLLELQAEAAEAESKESEEAVNGGTDNGTDIG